MSEMSQAIATALLTARQTTSGQARFARPGFRLFNRFRAGKIGTLGRKLPGRASMLVRPAERATSSSEIGRDC